MRDAIRTKFSEAEAWIPQISDEPGTAWELHLNALTLQATFTRVSRAA